MRLQITHRTHFVYAEPASDSFNEARLRPTSSGGQVCDDFQLKIQPSAHASRYIDLYRNEVHLFEISRAHRELTVTALSQVITTDRPVGPPLDAQTVSLTEIARCAHLELCHDFVQPSPYVELSPGLWRLAVDLTVETKDTWQVVLATMRHIHREFRYEPNTTQWNSTAENALQLRAGVCQDFTHVMLGVCRTLKIPARYVSGYLYNGPVDQLKGAQASHAWVEVYLPDFGWCGLDPTNNQLVDGRYVKVAIGRDYTDVSPIRGRYVGTARRDMTVDVLVTALEPTAVQASI